jgi:hypothetical protein
VLAEVHYHRGVEALDAFESVRLTLPLENAIRVKKEHLERVLGELRACAAHEVSPWNRAAAYQIGSSLIAFGDALGASERPRGLAGDDLAAYEDVLEERSYEFFDKGEEAWTLLLRRAAEADVEDEWVERARDDLWPRLASRFIHRPELEHPLVLLNPPEGVDQ